jgi:SpoVK/Ycf46/Vps4 family AAA+-type ATPase
MKESYGLNFSFYQLSSADILSKWAGESEKNIRNIFQQARKTAPSICKLFNPSETSN